jgi:hypothetical protein
MVTSLCRVWLHQGNVAQDACLGKRFVESPDDESAVLSPQA